MPSRQAWKKALVVRSYSFRVDASASKVHDFNGALAWTPVCATQIRNYEADIDWFRQHETHVLGISVDAAPSKVEWASSLGGISYDLLSDFHPHGAVAEAYGVNREDGISGRAVFVVDTRGTIAFAKVYDIPTLPNNAEVRQTIKRLSMAASTTPPFRT